MNNLFVFIRLYRNKHWYSLINKKMNKIQVRQSIKGILSRLTCEEKARQSESVFEKLIQHPKFKLAKRIFIYLNTNDEIDTSKIVEHAISSKKDCFIPMVLRHRIGDPRLESIKSRMIMVKLRSIHELNNLALNHYGIREPKENQIKDLEIANPLKSFEECDLFVIPGVAFTLEGRRLGHGKGYYDEFLMEWSERKRSRESFYTIGVCFREQLVENTFAVDGLDFKLDEVLIGSKEVS